MAGADRAGPNLLAAGLVLGIMGLMGIPLDIMTITIAAIVVGIGVDDCIHYVHRFIAEFPVDRNYRATMYRCHNSIGRAIPTPPSPWSWVFHADPVEFQPQHLFPGCSPCWPWWPPCWARCCCCRYSSCW